MDSGFDPIIFLVQPALHHSCCVISTIPHTYGSTITVPHALYQEHERRHPKDLSLHPIAMNIKLCKKATRVDLDAELRWIHFEGKDLKNIDKEEDSR